MFFNFIDQNAGFCERWGNRGCWAVAKYWYGYNISFSERQFSKTYEKISLNSQTKAQKLLSFLLFLPALVILPLGIILKGASFLSSDVRRKYTINDRTYDSLVYGIKNAVTISKIESIYAVIIDRNTDHSVMYAYRENAVDIQGDLVFKARNDFRQEIVFLFRQAVDAERLLCRENDNKFNNNFTTLRTGEYWESIKTLEVMINSEVLGNVNHLLVDDLLLQPEVVKFVADRRREFISSTVNAT